MRWPWQRSGRGRGRRDELPPRQAYDLWSESYGDPPNALQSLEARHLADLMPSVAGARVVDLGCGRGRVVAELSGRGPDALLGLDLSVGMLARWQAAGIPRVAGDLACLPLRERSFDLAIAALVLAHLPDLEVTLVGISNLIRPGGRLILSDFHPRAAEEGWQRTFQAPDTGGVLAVRHHRHGLDDYRRPLESMGWQLEAFREPRWKGVPVLLLMRWRSPGSARAQTA